MHSVFHFLIKCIIYTFYVCSQEISFTFSVTQSPFGINPIDLLNTGLLKEIVSKLIYTLLSLHNKFVLLVKQNPDIYLYSSDQGVNSLLRCDGLFFVSSLITFILFIGEFHLILVKLTQHVNEPQRKWPKAS